jgi:hypothetical protein
MASIASSRGIPVESTKQPLKRRKSCPICASEELTPLDGTFFEKVLDRVIGLRKYRCFMCGHVFEGKRSKSGKTHARAASDD